MVVKQSTRHKRIDAHFRPEDEELYQFVKSQVNGWGDTSQAIRRFVEIAQLFGGSLSEAQLAKKAADWLQSERPGEWEYFVKGSSYSFDDLLKQTQLARQALAYLQQTHPNWEELIKGE